MTHPLRLLAVAGRDWRVLLDQVKTSTDESDKLVGKRCSPTVRKTAFSHSTHSIQIADPT